MPLATPSKGQACGQTVNVHCLQTATWRNLTSPCSKTFPRTLRFSHIHSCHQKEINSEEVFSGGSSYSRVNQILILLIFGNKTMFKTIQISKAIWWGVRSCSPFNCAALNLFIEGCRCTSARSLFALGSEHVSYVSMQDLSSSPELKDIWVGLPLLFHGLPLFLNSCPSRWEGSGDSAWGEPPCSLWP